MKLKNKNPGKIGAKSDHQFQSYNHITVVKGPSGCWEQLPETRPVTRVIAQGFFLPVGNLTQVQNFI